MTFVIVIICNVVATLGALWWSQQGSPFSSVVNCSNYFHEVRIHFASFVFADFNPHYPWVTPLFTTITAPYDRNSRGAGAWISVQ